MILYNKYKLGTYLNLNDVIDLSIKPKTNLLKVNNLFKFSKKLIRSFLLLHFYTFSLQPFSSFLYKGMFKYHLKLESPVLILTNVECYENYFVQN